MIEAIPSQAISEAITKPNDSLVHLSVSRVKTMIKEDVEVKSISTEACFAVAKVTEQLMDDIARRGARFMFEENRQTLDYQDIAKSISECKAYDFLDEVIPKKVPAALALARMEQPQQQAMLAEQQQKQSQIT